MLKSIANTAAGPIEFTLNGSGPVILVSHGTSSDCDSAWGDQALLDAGFSILRPSRPGYGKTPPEVGETVRGAAGAMAALLDCLSIEQVDLIAISGGGPTGIGLASYYPQRVKKLILLSAVSKGFYYGLSEERIAQVKGTYGKGHQLSWFLLRLVSDIFPRQMARMSMMLFSSHDINDIMSQMTPEDIKKVGQFYHGRSSATGALLDMQHEVDEDRLNKIQAPTLIVHSQEDKAVPFVQAEFAKANIPNSELFIAPVWGHFYWIGVGSDEVNKKIIDFLRQD